MKLTNILNILTEGKTIEESIGNLMILEGWSVHIDYKNSIIDVKSPKNKKNIIQGETASKILNKVLYGIEENSFVLGFLQKSLLLEGVYDPGILKAIFLVGGPGSGKSYVLNQLFGMNSKITFSRHGLKLVNPDPSFEALLRKANMDPKNLDKMNQDDPENYAKVVDPLRNRAKEIEKGLEDNFINGRLGMVLEGTGKNLNNIKELKSKLENLGYDCYLMFVNTQLETASRRNQERSRTIPQDLLVSMWTAAQKNLGDLQNEFGSYNTVIIDNSDDAKLPERLSKTVESFIRTPVRNKIGKEWIKQQLNNKKR